MHLCDEIGEFSKIPTVNTVKSCLRRLFALTKHEQQNLFIYIYIDVYNEHRKCRDGVARSRAA